MPEICSCSAELPPDARFCHKCGKPQRDEPIADALRLEHQASAIPVLVVPPVPLSFRNPIALRVGLLASALLCLTMMIPGVNYGSVLWWLAAGYFSVWTYKRRTGAPLTVRGGAHMGWITGVFSCVLLTVLFAVIMAAIQRTGGIAALQTQLHELAIDQKTIDDAMNRLQHPIEIVTSLAEMFLLMLLFCSAGGAIGAKILGRD